MHHTHILAKLRRGTMTKKLLIMLLVLTMVLSIVMLAGCFDTNDNETPEGETVIQNDDVIVNNPSEGTTLWTAALAYTEAQTEYGYEGTFEEFLASLAGITAVNLSTDGDLIITLSDGTKLNVGNVMGETGSAGVGIASTVINDDGELVITYTDGTVVNAGTVVGVDGSDGTDGQDGADGKDGQDGTDGEDGQDGIGIASVAINDDGELVITYTDGTVVNVGTVVGGDSEDGVDESGGVVTEDATYTGSYSYDRWGITYGVKLDVTTVDGEITNIQLYSDSETGWVSLSDAFPDYGWTDTERQAWLDAVDDLLDSFYGMTAYEVGAISATIAGVVGSEDAVDSGYNVTGATQSTACVVLALQNALCGDASGVVPEAGDPVNTDGTYTGTDTGSYSEFEVTVVVTDGVVASVTVAETSKTNTSWTYAVTEAALTSLYNSVVGMTPAEVLAATTTEGFISGATDTSRTFLAAVADALTVKATD